MRMDHESLLQMLEQDEFGLLKTVPKREPVTGDDRLLASFQEITEFVRATGREPERTLTDMTEAKLAMRLQAIRTNAGQASVLRYADEFGLLGDAPPEPEPIVISDVPPDSVEDALATDPFGLLGDVQSIFDLKHVPASPAMPEKIAKRERAPDFELFEPLFKQCHSDLRAGRRKLLGFKNPSEIEQGKFFVLNGVLLYVANIGEPEFARSNKGNNARTRCIFENGTESDLLLLSLGRNLYKDGRRVTEPNEVTLERMGLQADTPMASVYVLRSLSDDPQVTELPGLHKIGSTSSTAAERTVHAASETTFLGAPVQIVEEYRVPRGIESKIEGILHRLFAPARIDAWFERDGVTIAETREWFAVPFGVIEEAVQLIESEAIVNYTYDPSTGELRLKP
jgi:hypothetical protein